MVHSMTRNINGQDTFIYYEGSGSPMVFLHGILATNDTWYYSLDAFKKNYLTIAPDLPGLGQSGWSTRAYTLSDYVDWLENLRRELDLKSMILVGHSMGGGISLAYAMHYPKYINHLILVDALGLSGKIPWSAGRFLLGRMPYLALALLTGRIDPYVYRYCQDWIFVEPHAKASPALQLMAKANLPRGIRTLEAGSRMLVADFLAEANRQKFISRLNNLALSTLILWGRHDGMLPVANAYAGARRIPSAELHIFENSAHMPMLEEPESFNSVIQNFLNKKTSRRRKTRYGKKTG